MGHRGTCALYGAGLSPRAASKPKKRPARKPAKFARWSVDCVGFLCFDGRALKVSEVRLLCEGLNRARVVVHAKKGAK
jgi:hypothetical protein